MFLSRKQMMEVPLVQHWLEEGRKEGALIAGRKDILIVLRARLKLTQTDEFAPTLERITDKERIDKRIWNLFGEKWAVLYTDG